MVFRVGQRTFVVVVVVVVVVVAAAAAAAAFLFFLWIVLTKATCYGSEFQELSGIV